MQLGGTGNVKKEKKVAQGQNIGGAHDVTPILHRGKYAKESQNIPLRHVEEGELKTTGTAKSSLKKMPFRSSLLR